MTVLSSRRRDAAFAFIMVTVILDIMSMGIIIPVLPALIEEFAGSNASAGIWNGVLIALWAVIQFGFSPVIGSLSDRYGRRPVILISTAGMAADFVLMALAPNLWWLAVGRIIGGLTAANHTSVLAYMADITPPEKRARAYGLLGAAFSGGFVLGPMLGGVLGEISPRTPFWVAAVLSGIAFLYGLFILPESLKPENRMPFSWRRANPLGALKLLRSHPELSGLAILTFMLHFAHHVFSAVFVLYAAERFGWHAFEVGLLLGAVGAMDMVVQGMVVGPLAKRFGDRRVMVIGLFGGAVGVACMGLAPTGPLFAAAVLPNALWGLAMPTLQSLMTRHVSESEQGQLQGANNSVASIAGVVSPLFFGAIYSMSVGRNPVLPHPGTAFLIAAALLFAAAFFGRAVTRRRAPDRPQEH